MTLEFTVPLVAIHHPLPELYKMPSTVLWAIIAYAKMVYTLKAPFNLEPRDIWPKHGGENFGWVGEEIRFLVPDMGVPLHKYFIFYPCMNTYI